MALPQAPCVSATTNARCTPAESTEDPPATQLPGEPQDTVCASVAIQLWTAPLPPITWACRQVPPASSSTNAACWPPLSSAKPARAQLPGAGQDRAVTAAFLALNAGTPGTGWASCQVPFRSSATNACSRRELSGRVAV